MLNIVRFISHIAFVVVIKHNNSPGDHLIAKPFLLCYVFFY